MRKQLKVFIFKPAVLCGNGRNYAGDKYFIKKRLINFEFLFLPLTDMYAITMFKSVKNVGLNDSFINQQLLVVFGN